ncbi:colicin immunity protein [Flavobacterium sp. '19STA2R22 D10 B1']|uniref:colicin immunity protein n=1 Tax=Flavobacterium aerium TaxID=3037261 RepID=UPI00278BE2C7|nr:colicin immunity protein [Flavobacterium sp. '19STA2R22 D10 B1']
MTREQLIELGTKILHNEGDEVEMENLIHLFDANVLYPNASNLFFYPENYNARRDNLYDYNPTVEEVVDKAMNYKAIEL